MTTYDTIPYPSYSYPQSSPAQMCAVAQLFGVKAAEIKKAKVLEIGCASGGNIIPLAARYPDATFVGLDLSKKQIELAQAQSKALGLKNMTFMNASITEHDFKQKKFDYIIAHGVYSWVASDVQEKLLALCGKHLSKNGVAFVSYNTLPGWNAVKTVRDMMLYHGQTFDDPQRKVVESRKMLKFVAENMQNKTGPYKETLEEEIKTLESVSDHYLLHDHLEDVNEPCYFHEFAQKAENSGLAYMADSNVASMYLGNQNKKVAGTLAQIDDPVRLEQYLDFMTNRRFRTSLLVKNGTKISRHVTVDRLKGLGVIPRFRLKKPIKKGQIGKLETLDMVNIANPSQNAQMTGRVLCTALIEMLSALPNRLSVEDVREKVAARLEDMKPEAIAKEMDEVLLKLVFNGVLTLTADTDPVCMHIAEKPTAFTPAMLLSQSMDLVPNQHHEVVKLRDDQRVVLQYVNGKNTFAQVCDAVKNHVEKGEINLAANGKPLDKNAKDIDGYIQQYVKNAFENLALNALVSK